ncbi:MAG: cytochrome d ubiquinol oxidase subunit II [Alphaproteobacteria bacterium]
MLDFSGFLDLPLIWALLIATAVFLYIMLDGFDLGVGIIFPLAPSNDCRSRMMNSIAPFWDGNETWLVLGGGGLFAAFPLAYSVLMPAFYMPIILMLLGLIFRGVAFEFRFKASEEKRWIWDSAFHFGSLTAAFMQGVILGNFIQGVEVTGRAFSGGPLDWANGFAVMTGIAVIFGYSLLGSTWLIMKTEGLTQTWARQVAKYSLVLVAFFMIVVSISTPFIDDRMFNVWFSFPNIVYLSIIPFTTLICTIFLVRSLIKEYEYQPFLFSIALFLLCYIGFGFSMHPWIVPFEFNIWQAAAAPTSQSILLIGTAIFLPIILAYTAFSFYTFRGKSSHEAMY